MTIYGIGGVSGTGKTHFRTRCRPLRDARTEDIADVYERAVAEGSPSLHWRTALNRFVHIVRRRLEADRESDIVLEAFFKRGGEQRRQLEALAAEFGIPIMYVSAKSAFYGTLQYTASSLTAGLFTLYIFRVPSLCFFLNCKLSPC